MIEIKITAQNAEQAVNEMEKLVKFKHKNKLGGHTEQSLEDDKFAAEMLTPPETVEGVGAVEAPKPIEKPVETLAQVKAAHTAQKAKAKAEKKAITAAAPATTAKRGRGRPPKKEEIVEEVLQEETIFDDAPIASDEELPTNLEAVEQEVEETKEIAPKLVTIDDVMKAFKDLNSKKGTNALRELLAKLNAPRVSAIDPKNYEKAIEAAQIAINQ